MDILEQQGIRIDLPLAELKDRKNCVAKECYLTLYPEYLTYKVVGTYESKNEDSAIWEHKSSNYRYTTKRSNISKVEMFNDHNEDLWCLTIEFGNSEKAGTSWHFQSPKECLEVYDQLQKYMITGL